LRTPGRALVPDQLGPADDWNRLVAVGRFGVPRPRLGELDAVDARDDIDPVGRHADLENDAGATEISRRQVLPGAPNA
jgi:hypothetical protein